VGRWESTLAACLFVLLMALVLGLCTRPTSGRVGDHLTFLRQTFTCISAFAHRRLIVGGDERLESLGPAWC